MLHRLRPGSRFNKSVHSRTLCNRRQCAIRFLASSSTTTLSGTLQETLPRSQAGSGTGDKAAADAGEAVEGVAGDAEQLPTLGGAAALSGLKLSTVIAGYQRCLPAAMTEAHVDVARLVPAVCVTVTDSCNHVSCNHVLFVACLRYWKDNSRRKAGRQPALDSTCMTCMVGVE